MSLCPTNLDLFPKPKFTLRQLKKVIQDFVLSLVERDIIEVFNTSSVSTLLTYFRQSLLLKIGLVKIQWLSIYILMKIHYNFCFYKVTFPLCRDYVDDWILVSEEEIAESVYFILNKHHKVSSILILASN